MSSLAELLRETPEQKDYFKSQGGEGEPGLEPGPEIDPVEPGDAEPAAPDPDLEPERVAPGDPDPAEPEPAEAEGRQDKVPFHALHEERTKRKEIQDKLDAQSQHMARMEGRFQQVIQGLQQAQQPPQPRPPTVEEDPIATLRALAAEREQQQAYSQQEQTRAQFEAHVGGLEQQYMRTNPDYPEAAAYLQQRRDADLQAMGITDAGRRHAALWQEAAGLAANAIQAGKNPAEVAYNLARSWGYQPKAQRQAPAEQRIEAAQRGQQASQSLSGGGGTAPGGLTLEALARMSDEDFAKVPEERWAKLWGG